MRLRPILPFVGTATLALWAAGIGYLAVNQPATTGERDQRKGADPMLQSPDRPDQDLALPPARPDIYYAAIIERPLFSPTRRPLEPDQSIQSLSVAAPQPIPPANPVARPEGLVLSGVLGQDTDRSAFLTRPGGTGEWFRVNDAIDGWNIAEIGPDWATLTAGDTIVRLELFE